MRRSRRCERPQRAGRPPAAAPAAIRCEAEVPADLLRQVGLAARRRGARTGTRDRRLGRRAARPGSRAPRGSRLPRPRRPRRRGGRSPAPAAGARCAPGGSWPVRSMRPGRTCRRRSSAAGARAGRAPPAPRRVGAALEAVRRLGVHAQRPRAAPDRRGGPTTRPRARRRCVSSEISLEAPPMIPARASAGSPPWPATTPTRAGQRALDAVERRQPLALARPAHAQRAARQRREVEGVASAGPSRASRSSSGRRRC